MSCIMRLLENPTPTESTNRLMRDCAIEGLATTLFIFCGTGAAVSIFSSGNPSFVLPIAMSFGITITFMAYSIGHLTGGHMNPAVSLLMFLKGQISAAKLAGYVFSQLIGSLLASALVLACVSELNTDDIGGSPPFNLGANGVSDDLSHFNGFMLEFMGSLVFYFVICQTALDKRIDANVGGHAALPIGLSLVIVHIVLIPFTGCGVNPARTFGPAMVTCMNASSKCDDVVNEKWWVYWVGPALAAFCVAEITNLMEWNCDDEEDNANDNEKNISTQQAEPVKELTEA